MGLASMAALLEATHTLPPATPAPAEEPEPLTAEDSWGRRATTMDDQQCGSVVKHPGSGVHGFKSWLCHFLMLFPLYLFLFSFVVLVFSVSRLLCFPG